MTDASTTTDHLDGPELVPARVRDGVLTMTVELPAAQQRVWDAITRPEELVRWSPVVPDRVLDSTGAASSQEDEGQPRVDATVGDVRAPWALEHQWGPDTLTWQLAPSGEGTQLNLVQELTQSPQAPDMAAGWHLCLDVLARRLRGEDAPRCVGPKALENGWQQLRDRYAAVFTEQEAARQPRP